MSDVVVRQLDEPELEFGSGTDARVKEGLTAHGPYSLRLGPRHPQQVRVGLVGPASPLAKTSEFLSRMRQAPPVPSTAIYSTSDGIAHWEGCIDVPEGPTTENVRVPGSHCGLGHNPLAVHVIADRLAQPEGKWRRFDRGGWRSLVFPPPATRNGHQTASSRPHAA